MVAANDHAVHVSRMTGTWKRIQVLALLVCGLVTAPFGSMEQFDAAENHNATSPCLSAAGATPLALHAPNSRADLPVRPFAPPAQWSLTSAQTEWRLATVVLPPESPGTVTYHANAPPFHLI